MINRNKQNSKESSFIRFIKGALKEQGLSIRQLALRIGNDSSGEGGVISYNYLTMILRGVSPTPKPSSLKHIAKALGIPYTTILVEAGYIDEESVSDLTEVYKEFLSPMFEEDVVNVLSTEMMQEILGIAVELKKDAREELLKGLLTYSRGFATQK